MSSHRSRRKKKLGSEENQKNKYVRFSLAHIRKNIKKISINKKTKYKTIKYR